MTHRRTWQKAEGRVAETFGTRRQPGSGADTGGTRSDSRHGLLFIETKFRQRFSLLTLWDETVAKAGLERKLPVVALVEKRRQELFAVVPLNREYLGRLMAEIRDDDAGSDSSASAPAGLPLWANAGESKESAASADAPTTCDGESSEQGTDSPKCGERTT